MKINWNSGWSWIAVWGLCLVSAVGILIGIIGKP